MQLDDPELIGRGAEGSSLPQSATIFRVSALPIGLSLIGHFALLNSAPQSQDDATVRGDRAARLAVTMRVEHMEERPAELHQGQPGCSGCQASALC